MIDLTIDAGEVALAASWYGDPEAPAVLLLHGIGNARDTWHDWATRWAASHQLFALDFRGHGHSSRAARYRLADYVADAFAALAHIGRPTAVIGHSLGGVVAGRLAQLAHPLVIGALLVDPAWFFGVPEEFARTVYPRRFELLAGTIAWLRAEGAPLATWVRTMESSPHPWGGTFADHTPAHLLAAHASALRRQDPRCWSEPVSEAFGGFDPLAPFGRPTTVVHADDRYGAALLRDQAQRLRAVNPTARFVWYEGSDHFPHRSHRFAAPFSRDAEDFLANPTGALL